MFDNRDLKRRVGVGTLLGLGFMLVARNTFRAIRSDASTFSRVVGITIPFALALVLLVGAIAITVYGLEAQTFRIAVWTVVGAGSLTVAIALNIVGLDLIRPDFALALYMVVNAAAGGSVLGFLIGVYDARRERLQEDLLAKNEETRTLSQRLSVLNRVLRHDVRNHAQVIQGQTEALLGDDAVPSEPAESIQRANARLTDLSESTRQLQSLLTDDAFETDPVDLVAVVRETVEAVQSSHPNLGVECDLPDEQWVSAPPMVDQALKHVLYNVVEHNDAPEPWAEITLTTESGPRPMARLTITDDGPGIPESEPLPNDGYTESQLRHSEGLGLWLVSWIIEEAEGTLDIETPDEPGVGTVVTISLPVAGRQ